MKTVNMMAGNLASIDTHCSETRTITVSYIPIVYNEYCNHVGEGIPNHITTK